MNTKEIAEQYEIPVELLAKILQILAKHGMVASHPGPTGGYKLLRPARDISVAEVVTDRRWAVLIAALHRRRRVKLQAV